MNEAKTGNLCSIIHQTLIQQGTGMFAWEIAEKIKVDVQEINPRARYLEKKRAVWRQKRAEGMVYWAIPGAKYFPCRGNVTQSRRGQRSAEVLRALPAKGCVTVKYLAKSLGIEESTAHGCLIRLIRTGEVEKLRISAYPKRYGYRRTAFAKEVAGVPRESLLDANERIQYELFSSSDFYPAQYRPTLRVRDCREKARKARLKDA